MEYKNQNPPQSAHDVWQIMLVKKLEAVIHRLIEHSVSLSHGVPALHTLCTAFVLRLASPGDLRAAAIDHQSLGLLRSQRSKRKNERGFGRAPEIKEYFVLKSPSNLFCLEVSSGTRHFYSSVSH